MLKYGTDKPDLRNADGDAGGLRPFRRLRALQDLRVKLLEQDPATQIRAIPAPTGGSRKPSATA